jgi:hypothetical protein
MFHLYVPRRLRALNALQVLCTFTTTDGTWAATQLRVLNAGLETGIKRFTPSDWGFGFPNYGRVDLFNSQTEVWPALRAAAAERPGEFEWGAFHPGAFMNYLGIGNPNPKAANGLQEGASLCWDVDKMTATLPLTKDGKVPLITLTELGDIGRAVSVACELPFGQWKEHMGIAGEVIALDEVVTIVEKVRGRKMRVDHVPFDTVQESARNATEMFEKMWWQLFQSFGRDEAGEIVFEANVNKIEGQINFQKVEEYVAKFWTGA